jgi:hypothetical protein
LNSIAVCYTAPARRRRLARQLANEVRQKALLETARLPASNPMSWDADGEGQTVGRTGGCLSEVTRIDMRGIGCDMANCSPPEENAGTVEKGSRTVKIVGTTMTQVAHKEGKRWGMEEGKDR